MDELFDIFDALSNLGDLTDLTDHADALLTALDGMDYIDFDASGLSMLDDLATFGTGDFGGVDAFDSVGDFVDSTDAFADPDLDLEYTEWHSLDDFAEPSAVDFSDVGEFVAQELDAYPDQLLLGLDGVEYHPEPNPECLGFWEPHGDSAHIELFDHQESIDLTLHHEMAHHLMATHQDLLDLVAPDMAESPMLEHFGIDLSSYPANQQPKEFVAEAFGFFKTKPEMLQQVDPALYEKFAGWWQTHEAVT